MKAWTRLMALALLVFAGSLATLHAAEEQPPEPAAIKLTLYHIQGSQTGKPVIDQAIQFLQKILAAFPQYDTFKLLDSPALPVDKTAPGSFTTGEFTTTVTIKGFTLEKDANKTPVWRADLKIEFLSGKTVISNITVRMGPGEVHTWQRENHIFVLQQAAGK